MRTAIAAAVMLAALPAWAGDGTDDNVKVYTPLRSISSSRAPPNPMRCMARATSATGAMEDPAAVMKAGEVFGPITQVRIAKAGGQMSYCAHGSYCYPSTNLEFASPCKISSTSSFDYDDISIYGTK